MHGGCRLPCCGSINDLSGDMMDVPISSPPLVADADVPGSNYRVGWDSTDRELCWSRPSVHQTPERPERLREKQNATRVLWCCSKLSASDSNSTAPATTSEADNLTMLRPHPRASKYPAPQRNRRPVRSRSTSQHGTHDRFAFLGLSLLFLPRCPSLSAGSYPGPHEAAQQDLVTAAR